MHEARKHNTHSREPTVMSVGPNEPRAPTIVSVPPLQMGVLYGSGVQAAISHQHASNPHPRQYLPSVKPDNIMTAPVLKCFSRDQREKDGFKSFKAWIDDPNFFCILDLTYTNM